MTQHRTTAKKSRYLAVFEQISDAQSRFVGKLNRKIWRLVDPRPEACLKMPNVDACAEKTNNNSCNCTGNYKTRTFEHDIGLSTTGLGAVFRGWNWSTEWAAFSAQASTLGVFKHASGLGATNLLIFRFNFPKKRLWASIICSKTVRYRLFLAVVRCYVTTTLAAETFSLLCVYLNYKFGLGLPSFCLFFSFFKLFHYYF